MVDEDDDPAARLHRAMLRELARKPCPDCGFVHRSKENPNQCVVPLSDDERAALGLIEPDD